MYKHTTKNKSANRTILRHDLGKIRDAIALTAKDFGDQTKNSLSHSLENIKDKSVDLQDSVANYVGDKPFKALALAILSGFILGASMRKKKRHFPHR